MTQMDKKMDIETGIKCPEPCSLYLAPVHEGIRGLGFLFEWFKLV